MNTNEEKSIEWLKSRLTLINTPRKDEFVYLDENGEWVCFFPLQISNHVEFINEYGKNIGPKHKYVYVDGLKQKIIRRPIYFISERMLEELKFEQDYKKVLSDYERLKICK